MTGAAAPRFSGMRDFRKLIVWQKGHRLTLEVHSAACAFPRRKHSGLANQITRAAASIPATLAEGCGKSTDGELARFTDMSLTSAKELENHLILARDLGLLESDMYDRLDRHLDEVRRMLLAVAV
ncbi:MAG TPA: four helix bundle protein, partial [Gemmatimonadaceae bacterium]|nr:four helix bundle protein [Gemmatimonadaceae bacterium]